MDRTYSSSGRSPPRGAQPVIALQGETVLTTGVGLQAGLLIGFGQVARVKGSGIQVIRLAVSRNGIVHLFQVEVGRAEALGRTRVVSILENLSEDGDRVGIAAGCKVELSQHLAGGPVIGIAAR